MNILRLSYQNLKRNFHSYLAFIFSLSFCTFILYNFLHLMDSGTLNVLGKRNEDFSEMIIAAVTVVLVFFVCCFIWYASNVFLNQHKKEMGTFIFMGLDHKQLGRMYFSEMMMVGVLAILSGILTGILFSKLFGMLFFKLSEIEEVISFTFQFITVLKTALIFLIIYLGLMGKGYWNIIHTSVKDMLSATKQSEMKKTTGGLTLIKAMISLGILCAGYDSAMQIGGLFSFSYMLIATVCVIIGVYGLYDSLMPYVLTKICDHKQFLYQKERNLWINHLIFRIKKNYRTYAIVTIMMICCVSALSAGLAMKQRYDAIHSAEAQFTYTFFGDELSEVQINSVITKYHDINVSGSIPFFYHVYQEDGHDQYAMIISYNDYVAYCHDVGIPPLEQTLADWEGIKLHRKILLSMGEETHEVIPIQEKELRLIESSDEPFFGMMQYNMNIIIVSDKTYQACVDPEMEMQLYNTRISDVQNYQEGLDEIKALTNEHIQTVVADPQGEEIVFIRVVYSVCIFMFAVFAFSCGGVIFMKTYHDANDDRQRYLVLQNIGISRKSMHRAIRCELAFAYIFPIFITAVSSYFIMVALQNLMRNESLMNITFLSITILFIFYMILYLISVASFEKRCKIRK